MDEILNVSPHASNTMLGVVFSKRGIKLANELNATKEKYLLSFASDELVKEMKNAGYKVSKPFYGMKSVGLHTTLLVKVFKKK